MKILYHLYRRKILAMAVALAMPAISQAEPSNEELQNQINALQEQLSTLNGDIQQAAEWKNPNTLVHMSGYADVGFSQSDAAGDGGSFSVGTFAPIFHYQYRDLVMLESELEFEVGETGETEVKLEYLSIDWFVNDNMALVAGQFLSPIGQFRQNLHPSWINKLPSAAPGFGHDGAAPVSDLGIQLRGGFRIGGIKANYAVYMGNGPEIKAEVEDDGAGGVDEIEYDGVEAEAFGADRDDEKVFGGRLGLLPTPTLEIGLSFLSGKATVTSYEDLDLADFSVTPPPDLDTTEIAASDYNVTGLDVSWRRGGMDVRFEFVKSEVGETTIGVYDLEEAEWSTWYAQCAYRFMSNKHEVVLRYADFDSPHSSADRQQTVVGFNYLFANNFIGKVAFESNENPNSGFTADNRTLLQLAYGF